MGEEFSLTKEQAKKIFDGLIKGLGDKDIVYISKVLCGNLKASKNEKRYMEVGFGVNPHLFKDKGKSVMGLMNSNMFLIVIPKKEFINPEIKGGKDE